MRDIVSPLSGIRSAFGQRRGISIRSLLFGINEVGTWFDPSDLTTLFQDSAGTTPVTAPNQPVGLMLDKSKGLALGPELLVNGDFSQGSTGWSSGVGWSISGGVATHTGSTGVLVSTPATAFAIGSSYIVEFDYSGNSGAFQPYLRGISVATSLSTVSGRFRAVGIAGSNTNEGLSILATANLTIDNVSVKLLSGNHATQATAASRPTYGIHPITGVRNFAKGSAAYDNATFWNTSATNNGVTIARSGSGVDFDGLSYVDYSVTGTALLDTTSGAYLNSESRVSAASGQSFTSSFIARIVSGTVPPAENGIRADVIGESAPSTFIEASTSAVLAPTVDTLISVSRSLSNVTTNQARGVLSILTRPGITVNYTIRIKALQFERSPARTAYQSNFNQFNITEAGVASVSYLGFDGVDDGMATGNINFSTTDAVTVFTGLRKLSESSVGTVVELTGSGDGTNGGFFVRAPASVSGANYQTCSRGTIAVTALAEGFVTPITNVVTFFADISSDINVVRVNGIQRGASSADQGTGNYANAILYIGRRGGSSLPFNGSIYSLIVRGTESTTGQITSTEGWVNGKTGAY